MQGATCSGASLRMLVGASSALQVHDGAPAVPCASRSTPWLSRPSSTTGASMCL